MSLNSTMLKIRELVRDWFQFVERSLKISCFTRCSISEAHGVIARSWRTYTSVLVQEIAARKGETYVTPQVKPMFKPMSFHPELQPTSIPNLITLVYSPYRLLLFQVWRWSQQFYLTQSFLTRNYFWFLSERLLQITDDYMADIAASIKVSYCHF